MNISKDLIEGLEEKSKIIRRHVVKVIHDAKVGHPGGSLSAVDILTVLYFHTLRIDPDNPNWEDRDRFIDRKSVV